MLCLRIGMEALYGIEADLDAGWNESAERSMHSGPERNPIVRVSALAESGSKSSSAAIVILFHGASLLNIDSRYNPPRDVHDKSKFRAERAFYLSTRKVFAPGWLAAIRHYIGLVASHPTEVGST